MNSTEEIPKNKEETKSSPLECNICYEDSSDPVATHCGHIYCWSCIYKWIQTKKEQAICPVCNNVISEEKIIPLYTKNNENARKTGEQIPKRPQPKREERKENNENQNGRTFGGFNMSSIFNSMFASININAANTRIHIATPTLIPFLIFLAFNLFSGFFGTTYYYEYPEETHYRGNQRTTRHHQSSSRSNYNSYNSRQAANVSNTSVLDYSVLIGLIVFFAITLLIKRLRR